MAGEDFDIPYTLYCLRPRKRHSIAQKGALTSDPCLGVLSMLVGCFAKSFARRASLSCYSVLHTTALRIFPGELQCKLCLCTEVAYISKQNHSCNKIPSSIE